MLGLKGKIAFVTGAGSGIGRAVCLALASQGVRIAAVDVDPARVQGVAEEVKKTGAEATAITADVSKREQVESGVLHCVKVFGGLDILVNSAGINYLTPQWDKIPEHEWDQIFAVNVKGAYYCMCAAAGRMKPARWGRIINIGSLAGKVGGVISGVHYCASKAAVMCMTKNFAVFLAPFGITVNSIAPGVIETAMTRDWPEEMKRKYIRETPVGRIGRPEDVAGAVLYLASTYSDFVTGETLDVNGGKVMD